MRVTALLAFLLVGCAGVNRYNSDIYNLRCYRGRLYYYDYRDGAQNLIPVRNGDGEHEICYKTLNVDTKK